MSQRPDRDRTGAEEFPGSHDQNLAVRERKTKYKDPTCEDRSKKRLIDGDSREKMEGGTDEGNR